MPYVRRFRRKFIARSRRFAGRSRRRFRRTYQAKGLSRISRRIVPTTKVAKLVFSQYITLDPTITSFVQHPFRATSIYDPDADIGGYQPLGYDQWSLFYPNWVVLKSTCKVQQGSQDTNVSGVPAMFGVTLSNDSLLPAGWANANLAEAPDTSWRMIPSWGGAPLVKAAKVTYTARRWWGVQDITDTSFLWGQTASNPSTNTFFNVWTAATDGLSDLGAIDGMVTITYIVMFRNTNSLAAS